MYGFKPCMCENSIANVWSLLWNPLQWKSNECVSRISSQANLSNIILLQCACAFLVCKPSFKQNSSFSVPVLWASFSYIQFIFVNCIEIHWPGSSIRHLDELRHLCIDVIWSFVDCACAMANIRMGRASSRLFVLAQITSRHFTSS